MLSRRYTQHIWLTQRILYATYNLVPHQHYFKGKRDIWSDGFYLGEGLRVTESWNCCWPSATSFSGDFVSRFNPQILDLNRSDHWPAGLLGLENGPSYWCWKDLVTGWWIVEELLCSETDQRTHGTEHLSQRLTSRSHHTIKLEKTLPDPTPTQSGSLSCSTPASCWPKESHCHLAPGIRPVLNYYTEFRVMVRIKPKLKIQVTRSPDLRQHTW